MRADEIKIFSYVTIAFAAVSWGLLTTLFSVDPFSIGSLKTLNAVAATVSVTWGAYFAWGWKRPYFRKLLFRPNINGTWLGHFKSDWKNGDGLGVPPGRFVLVVRQTFFSISVRGFSEKQKTNSYVESLVCNDGRGTKFIAYLFQEKRTSGAEQSLRQGAAELDIIEKASGRILEGEFWTHTGTTGFVRVKHTCETSLVESFAEAQSKWESLESWEVI